MTRSTARRECACADGCTEADELTEVSPPALLSAVHDDVETADHELTPLHLIRDPRTDGAVRQDRAHLRAVRYEAREVLSLVLATEQDE